METNRLTPAEMLKLFSALRRLGSVDSNDAQAFQSPFLKEAISSCSALAKPVEEVFNIMDLDKASEPPFLHIFKAGYNEELDNLQEELQDVEQGFQDELQRIRRILKKPTLKFISVAEEDYLIEVPVQNVALVPPEWPKINSTKACYRYRPASIATLMEDKERRKERLEQGEKLCSGRFAEVLL